MIKFDYTNTNLDKCLTKLGQSNLIRNISIKPEIFVDYLDADIFNYESLLLIDYFNDVKLIADSLIQEGNKSDEIEFTLNKIHISDFIDKPKSKSSIIYLEYGLILLKQLMYKLHFSFEYEITIVLSYNTSGRYRDCILTLFKSTNGINNYQNIEYLNNFKNEAVGVVIVNKKKT